MAKGTCFYIVRLEREGEGHRYLLTPGVHGFSTDKAKAYRFASLGDAEASLKVLAEMCFGALKVEREYLPASP